MRRSRTGRGFSLIEMMVVLVIVSIFAAMVVPEFGGTYRHTLLRGAGRTLVAVLNLAASEAVTSGAAHRFRLDRAAGRYWIDARERNEGRRFVPLVDIPGSVGVLPEKVMVDVRRAGEEEFDALRPAVVGERDIVTIVFKPDGTAQAFEFRLSDETGYAFLVRVNPTTSRVSVEERGREIEP